MKILFVCLGNICRSPMAEGIMRHKVSREGLDWKIDSCATSNYHIGDPPDPRSIKKMQEKGLNISDLKGRQLSGYDFEIFDLIYVMDKSNFKNAKVLTQSDEEKQKLKCILEEYPVSSEYTEVPDPYWSKDDGFELVYDLLDKACSLILKRYKNL